MNCAVSWLASHSMIPSASGMSTSSASKNVWNSSDLKKIPGHDDRFVRYLEAVTATDRTKRIFRVVFSITKHQGLYYRQLSVSIHGGVSKKRMPNPDFMTTVAKLLGFVGELGDWQMNVRDKDKIPNVEFIQPYGQVAQKT